MSKKSKKRRLKHAPKWFTAKKGFIFTRSVLGDLLESDQYESLESDRHESIDLRKCTVLGWFDIEYELDDAPGGEVGTPVINPRLYYLMEPRRYSNREPELQYFHPTDILVWDEIYPAHQKNLIAA